MLQTKKKRPKNHYLTNEDFNPEHALCMKNNMPSEKLVTYFSLLANNLSKKLVNVDSQTLNACINYSISQAWTKWNKFDINVSENPFAYFTSVIYNDMLTHLEYIKRHSNRSISMDAILSSVNK